MPSTFLGLNVSYTGLVASNAALNTTSNNIANIETDGYSRYIRRQHRRLEPIPLMAVSEQVLIFLAHKE